MNFYQLAKNETVSSIRSGEIVHLKILLAEGILVYISGTGSFSNKGFLHEQSK